VGADYLLTNETGDYLYLKAAEFKHFLEGKLNNNSAKIPRALPKKIFIRDKN
jgi:hypothetical protein